MYFNETHQWQLALQDLNSCLRLKPTFSGAFVMRGAVNDRLGNFRDSLADYNGLVRLNPRDSWMLDCRASLLATCPDASVRNGPAAINDATTACKISNWGTPQFIDTLAAAYAEAGDFDSAIRFEEQAIAKATKAKVYSTGMKQRLALYQQHKPYREPLGTSPRNQAKSSYQKNDG
jgi:tetratricopeptide (TPR) repeat protein